MYSPELEIVPTVALPPVTPLTCQVTAVLLVFCTVAVNCCVLPAPTVADIGEIVTINGIGVSVVDTPVQPKGSNIVIAAPASHTQDASVPIVFRLQPQPLVFIASQKNSLASCSYSPSLIAAHGHNWYMSHFRPSSLLALIEIAGYVLHTGRPKMLCPHCGYSFGSALDRDLLGSNPHEMTAVPLCQVPCGRLYN